IPSFSIVHRGSPSREAGVGAHAPEGRQPDESTLRLLAPASKGLTGDVGDWPPERADRGTKLGHPIRIPTLLVGMRTLGQRTEPLRGGKGPGLRHGPSVTATRPTDADFAPRLSRCAVPG